MNEIDNAPPEALEHAAGLLAISALSIRYLLARPYRTHQFIDWVRSLPGEEGDATDGQLIEDMHHALVDAVAAAERAEGHAVIAYVNEVTREAANGQNKRGKEDDQR
jgi:hypothetical protein